jgi:hypothetical protein
VQEGLDLYNYLIGINVSAVARFSKDEAKIGTIEGKFYFYGIDVRCTVRYPNGGFVMSGVSLDSLKRSSKLLA